jgi:Fe2+ or Zn2+ uptake regulation protein
MRENDALQLLDIIGFSLTDWRARVLKAILITQRDQDAPVAFDEICQTLQNENLEKRIAQPLIYRNLSSLEKDGYIEVDKSSYKHRYWTGIDIIHAALEKAKAISLAGLRERVKQAESDSESISDASISSLATKLVETITGIPSQQHARFAQGYDDIYNMSMNTVYARSERGDVVRICLDWISSNPSKAAERIMDIIRLLERGVEIRALGHTVWTPKDDDGARLSAFYGSVRDEGLPLTLKIYPKNERTYQFISRNQDGIVLIVSETPPTATWIPRRANPYLVDEAISSFDKDFTAGIDSYQGVDERGDSKS